VLPTPVSGTTAAPQIPKLDFFLKIADLFNSFCEKVYAVAFFKVVQQQTIGEVENSITYLWADNFCQQQGKIIKIGQFFRKLC